MSHEHPENESGLVVDHDHDVEAVEQLGSDEPHTPTWMPLLGGVLFLCAAIFFVATRPAGKTGEELSRDASKAAAEAAAKAAPPPAPEAAQMPMPMPGAPGGGQPAAKGG